MTENPLPALIRAPEAHFSESDLAVAEETLRQLSNEARVQFRNTNAMQIAEDASSKMLVVAGPGAGKSFLFMNRIRSWLADEPQGSIRVASFVRKLVGDLKADVERLEPEQERWVEVSTLHSLARSLIERNGGCSSQRLGPYVRVISKYWEDVVWGDVLGVHALEELLLRDLKTQFHDNEIPQDAHWLQVRLGYFRICRFYNAVGFADSIVWATEAVRKNPDLVDGDLWILDEFQDFNRAEEALILALTRQARGVLLAGDDDQALYQQLKSSHPEIIRGYYGSNTYAKAQLPFCSRCSYHIALASEHFLKKRHAPEAIRKVFLPLQVEESAERVRIIACAHPNTVAAYVEGFIAEHRDEIDARRAGLENGTEKDPYLLILSFSRDLNFLGVKAEEQLESAAAEWRLSDPTPGTDYFRVLLYARCARVPTDNFTLRKVLHHENVSDRIVHDLIRDALATNRSLSEGTADDLTNAKRRCRHVLKVLESDSGPEEKAAAVGDLLPLDDPDQLVADLRDHPVGEDNGIPKEEEEELFTPGRLSPVEILSMAGAKGLSADHVILVGFGLHPTFRPELSREIHSG